MSKDIELRDILRVMKGLGFHEVSPGKGSRLIYRHDDDESGLVVTLPGARSKVPMSITMAIIRQVENYGISSREDILKKLKIA